MKWSALHDAADTVALIASIEAQAMTPAIRNFPVALRETGATRREQAEQGIDVLTAMMEPGLSALLAAHARGANPQPAARALWQEFVKARDGLLTLVPAQDGRKTLRSA